MTYIVPEIALATRGDIVGILDLQEQNLLGRGGLLSVRLPGAFAYQTGNPVTSVTFVCNETCIETGAAGRSL